MILIKIITFGSCLLAAHVLSADGARQSYNAGRFAFVLDGENMGFVKSVKGGIIKGEVAAHQSDPSNPQKKHIATITHEDITLEVGMDMGRGLHEWIQESIYTGHVTKSGEIISADFDGKAQRVMEFYDAHITEVTLPVLDDSSKDPAYLMVKIEPERLRHEKELVSHEFSLGERDSEISNKWLTSNFRFKMGDLPTSRVSKINAFTIKQTVVEDDIGTAQEPTKQPGKLEIPNLTVYICLSDTEIDPWLDWYRSSIINGKTAIPNELEGSIVFLGLDTDKGKELARIELELEHVRVVSLELTKQEGNEEDVSRLKVEMYVEEVKFNIDSSHVDS